ncbi:alcohol dehydrogenase catalytic domain-containing protein [Elusimicrobiota bacterium]
MKVAVYYNNKDIRTEDRLVPKIGRGELLVKVHASGICGSDVMEWYRIKKAPLVLGHEIGAEIIAVGAGVKGFKKGHRVFVTHHVPCNKCGYCRTGKHTICNTLKTTNFHPGGFSQFLRVPAINVTNGTLKLPKTMSYEEATFIEPLACVIRGFNAAEFKKGKSVCILGCGISGALHVALAKAYGASNIVAGDITASRMRIAKKFGAKHVFNVSRRSAEAIKKLNHGKLFDHVFVCAGAQKAFSDAYEYAAPGGTVMLFAPPAPGRKLVFDGFDLWHSQVKTVSTYAASLEDNAQALKLIALKKVPVRRMITHRLPIDRAKKGFELVAQAKNSLKVIILPHKA